MGKHSSRHILLHARGEHEPFRFEDDADAATGHAMVMTQGLSPRFSLRREVEGCYVLPKPEGPDRGRDDQDGADDGE